MAACASDGRAVAAVPFGLGQRSANTKTTREGLSALPRTRGALRFLASGRLPRRLDEIRLRRRRQQRDEEDGEVTATQKVKRLAIGSEFSDLIAAMYGEGAS